MIPANARPADRHFDTVAGVSRVNSTPNHRWVRNSDGAGSSAIMAGPAAATGSLARRYAIVATALPMIAAVSAPTVESAETVVMIGLSDRLQNLAANLTVSVRYADGATFGIPHATESARYVVGGYGTASVISRMDARNADVVREVVRTFVALNRYRLELIHADGTPMFGVGHWVDANGRIWLDVVSTFRHFDNACDVARTHGELAVWDSVTCREVDAR